jgi:hypothetical protein
LSSVFASIRAQAAKFQEEPEMDDKDTLTVATADTTVTRGRINLQDLKLDDLTAGMNAFVAQMGRILEHTQDRIGSFEFDSLEVSAQISAKGQFVLMGVGGEAGATGGIKLTFKRSAAPQ